MASWKAELVLVFIGDLPFISGWILYLGDHLFCLRMICVKGRELTRFSFLTSLETLYWGCNARITDSVQSELFLCFWVLQAKTTGYNAMHCTAISYNILCCNFPSYTVSLALQALHSTSGWLFLTEKSILLSACLLVAFFDLACFRSFLKTWQSVFLT